MKKMNEYIKNIESKKEKFKKKGTRNIKLTIIIDD